MLSDFHNWAHLNMEDLDKKYPGIHFILDSANLVHSKKKWYSSHNEQ